MSGRLAAFGLGFAFGALALVVLRHELNLNSRARTVATLLGVGAFLLGVLIVWSRRIESRGNGGPDPWRAFLWTGGVLAFAYVVLATVVLFL